MKLQAGKAYKMRNEGKVFIIREHPGYPYKFEGNNGQYYTEDGFIRHSSTTTDYDIISEWEEPSVQERYEAALEAAGLGKTYEANRAKALEDKITPRDLFAAAALQGLLAIDGFMHASEHEMKSGLSPYDVGATECMRWADAMMKARKEEV